MRTNPGYFKSTERFFERSERERQEEERTDLRFRLGQAQSQAARLEAELHEGSVAQAKAISDLKFKIAMVQAELDQRRTIL